MKNTYLVINTDFFKVLGAWQANSWQEALDAYAQACGYLNFTAIRAVSSIEWLEIYRSGNPGEVERYVPKSETASVVSITQVPKVTEVLVQEYAGFVGEERAFQGMTLDEDLPEEDYLDLLRRFGPDNIALAEYRYREAFGFARKNYEKRS